MNEKELLQKIAALTAEVAEQVKYIDELEQQVADLEDECGRLYSDSIEIMG